MILLAIAFPLCAHAAVVTRNGVLTLVSLAVLALLVLLPRLVRWNGAAWAFVPVVIALLIFLWRVHAAWLPLYATPVLISFGVAWLFGHTLAPGAVPLVERLVRVMHPADEISPEILAYARRVTLAWTVMMTAMGLLNLALALIAEPDGVLQLLGYSPPVTVRVETWSLFANALNYLIVGVFFLAEFIYRHRRFPEHRRYRNLLDFVRRAAVVGPTVFRTRHDDAA
jgi:uncharacterized membrane protein